jgi:thiamine kinase-like enzyme
LESGVSIIVQPFVPGRTPSRADYRDRLVDVAELLRNVHHNPRLQKALPAPLTRSHKDAGLQALSHLQQKWNLYKAQVPSVGNFIDQSLKHLARQINQFSSEGLVVSHGDICNANWLFAADDRIYLLDFESMAMDDPAFDLGALLWWYYPPRLRQEFVEIAGYRYDDEFRFRMQTRMAMHCLSITLPREESFDSFDANTYSEALNDFRTILNGEENPQGYDE